MLAWSSSINVALSGSNCSWRPTCQAMLFSGDLHVLSLSETVDPLVVDVPVTFQHLSINTFSPKSWALPGQSTHFTKQPWFIIRPWRLVSLDAARLVEHATCSTLRNQLGSQMATHLGDPSPLPFGAYQFPFTVSFQISISRAWLATIFFNRTFSFHSNLSSFSISRCLPPYFCRQRS